MNRRSQCPECLMVGWHAPGCPEQDPISADEALEREYAEEHEDLPWHDEDHFTNDGSYQ